MRAIALLLLLVGPLPVDGQIVISGNENKIDLNSGKPTAVFGAEPDSISVIDLSARPIRTVDYVTIGSGPESLEASPDGKLVAVVLMHGSSAPASDPRRAPHGILQLLARRGKTYTPVERIPVGRIPEGVAFTAGGKFLLVQCHRSREIWVFRISGESAVDTGQRIRTPGFPSSLRAAP